MLKVKYLTNIKLPVSRVIIGAIEGENNDGNILYQSQTHAYYLLPIAISRKHVE